MKPEITLTLTLAVDDLQRSAAFYRGMLGMAPEEFLPAPGLPPCMLLRCGDSTILFRQAQALEASHPALFQNLDRHPRGIGVTIELSCTDLEQVRRNLTRGGIHLLYELEDREFDRRELWVQDPDGFLLILMQEASSPQQNQSYRHA